MIHPKFPRTSLMSDAEFLAFILANPIRGGKGDSDIKQQEQNQQAFNSQLANAFSTQFGAQSQILNFLNGKLTNQVNNPQGFTPQQMAALNTNNTEGAATNFKNSQQATQAIEAARGGSALPSGVDAQLTAQNATAAAAQQAQGSNQIQLANAATQEQNYWNSISALNNVAQGENATGFGALYNSGSSNVGTLGQQYNATQQSQLESTIGSVLSGAAGGLTAGILGKK